MRLKRFLIIMCVAMVLLMSTAYAQEDLRMYAINLVIDLIKRNNTESEMFLQCYYHRDSDSIVIEMIQDLLTEEEFKQLVDFNKDFPEDLTSLLVDTVYKEYKKWIDTARLDINLVFSFYSSDAKFIYEVKNGVYCENNCIE